MKNILFLFLVVALTVSSCRKDILIEDQIFIPIGEDVITNLHGRVVDESGRSIPEASVTIENTSVFTNGDGYFHLLGAVVPSDGFIIKVEDLNGNRILKRVVPQEATNTYEEIVLTSTPESSAFSTSEESIIINGSTTLTIKPNTLVDNEGNLYEGDYFSRIIHYSTRGAQNLKSMPGNLQGIDRNGDRVTLGSYGMVDIEVMDINGKLLDLSPESTAIIRMQVPGQLIENLPQTIPTWRLDEQSGLWLEEGEVRALEFIEDEAFVLFEVDKFAIWNCDIKELNTDLSGTILDQAGVPIENRLIVFTFNSEGQDFYCMGGNTNSRGEYKARVPKDIPLTISIYDQNCEDFIYEEEIEALTGKDNIKSIDAVISKETYTVTGYVAECGEGIPYNNATVFLYNENNEVRMTTQTNEDGTFAIHNVCYDTNFEERYRIGVLDLNTGNYIYKDSLFNSEIDVNLGNVIQCETDSFYVNVESTLGILLFENPETSFKSDSLIITAESALGNFQLSTIFDDNGNPQFTTIILDYGLDQKLFCNGEFSPLPCENAVDLIISNINEERRTISGTIDGVLYLGEPNNPDVFDTIDIYIEFYVMY